MRTPLSPVNSDKGEMLPRVRSRIIMGGLFNSEQQSSDAGTLPLENALQAHSQQLRALCLPRKSPTTPLPWIQVVPKSY